jgi:hypothetical protein
MKNFIFVLLWMCFVWIPATQAQSHSRPFQPKTAFNKQNRPQKYAFLQADVNPPPPQTEHSEPQATYLVTELSFWVHNLEYTGLLIMENGVGKMRIHYDNPNDPDGCKIIEQNIHLVKLGNGNLYLEGSDPMDVRTGTWANYHPDNIFISQDKSGNPIFLNVDENGNSAYVEMETITSESRFNQLKKFYYWD